MSYKPILFNTEMVQAIQDGRKTQTRRIVKNQDGIHPRRSNIGFLGWDDGHGYQMMPPCEEGDILWVRETWAHPSEAEVMNGADPDIYLYKAECPLLPAANGRWYPSIHMPKHAARIFLRVKDVRVEPLQDMRLEDCLAEGVRLTAGVENDLVRAPIRAREWFSQVWDSTIKPADLDMYGWDANPWVWVIEFERCERPADFL